jgi:hypothetical protein
MMFFASSEFSETAGLVRKQPLRNSHPKLRLQARNQVRAQHLGQKLRSSASIIPSVWKLELISLPSTAE